MLPKQYVKSMVLAMTITGFSVQTAAIADGIPMQQPTYSNSTEAQQAAHIADRQADSVNASLRTSLDHLNEMEEQLSQMQLSGNRQQVMSTQTVVDDAQAMYVDMLSDMTGVSRRDINDMHSTGASWSEMADELGMQIAADQQMNNGQRNMAGKAQGINHQQGSGLQMNTTRPGAMTGFRSTEILSATVRNTESGWARGHGMGLQTGVQTSEGDDMMSGAAGLNNSMGDADMDGHDGGGMSGGMGASSGGGSSNSGGGMGGGGNSGGGHGGGGGMH